MALPSLFHRFRNRALTAVAAASVLVAVAATPSAAATGKPSGPYTAMDTCPTSGSQLQDPNQAVVGCVVATIGGGGFAVGSTQVNFGSPMTVTFGVTWAKGGPAVTFPDIAWRSDR